MSESLRYDEIAATHVLPYRCGHVCRRALEDHEHCRCPSPMGEAYLRMPISTARERGGPCGPEAVHLRLQ